MSFIQTIPPPNPKGLVGMVGAVVLVVGLLFAVAWCGCAEPAKVPAYCTDEVAFTARLVACVDQSSSRALSRACRVAVHERCGITMVATDGGAP